MLGLLSLIPHLIKRLLRVRVVGVGVAGWNTSAAGFEPFPVVVVGGLGTLLGPEKTPGSSERWFFFGRSGRGLPNACLCGWWLFLGRVWLWVECCIVDASILLWSSV